MAEAYTFEYNGAEITINVTDVNAVTTTTSPPNVRKITGTWPTWRIEVNPDIPGPSGVKLLRSVSTSSTSTPHPNGNLTPSQSSASGYMLMCAPNGTLYKVPGGFGVVSRLMTDSEWAFLRASWEQNL